MCNSCHVDGLRGGHALELELDGSVGFCVWRDFCSHVSWRSSDQRGSSRRRTVLLTCISGKIKASLFHV